MSFDHSGMFLAVGGPDVRIYSAQAKADWPLVATFSDLPSQVRSSLRLVFSVLSRFRLPPGRYGLRVLGDTPTRLFGTKAVTEERKACICWDRTQAMAGKSRECVTGRAHRNSAPS